MIVIPPAVWQRVVGILIVGIEDTYLHSTWQGRMPGYLFVALLWYCVDTYRTCVPTNLPPNTGV